MRERFSIARLIRWLFSAAFAAGIAYLAMCAALHVWDNAGAPLSALSNFLAISVAAIVFAVVLWRSTRASWGREQSDALLGVVDDD